MEVLATYVHDLSPEIIKINEQFALRWYGLAYLAGFVAGFYFLRYLATRKLYPVAADKLGDFIFGVALFGVLLGGRLGHVFFYMLPDIGWEALCRDPLVVFRVWEGGMASHGGMIGVILYALYYSLRHKINWLSLLDGLAIVAPVGLFCGRIANFINGELYGRVTDSTNAVAMKFPMEMYERPELANAALMAMHQKCPPGFIDSLFAKYPIEGSNWITWLVNRTRDTPQVRDIVGDVLSPRYPSQLFEAAGEGLFLFVLLWGLRLYCKQVYSGVFCATFCVVYAVMRVLCEMYREPEQGDSLLMGWMTRGQFLSCLLALAGVAFWIYAQRSKVTVQSVIDESLQHESVADKLEEEKEK